MRLRKPLFDLLSYWAVAISLSCCVAAQAVNSSPQSARPSSAKSGGPATSLVHSLSLHDRLAQLIVVRGYGDYPPADNAEYRRFIRWIREDHVGGFIVAGLIRDGNVIPAQPFEMAAFINHVQRTAKIPLLVASN